jgi:hypothetical protein
MDISEAINEAVGSVLTEQEAITESVEAESVKAQTDTEEVEVASDEVESVDSEEIALDDSEQVTEEDAEPEAEEADVPEGYAVVPVLEGDLETSFALFDKEGELEVPDLTIEVANHERDERNKQVEAEAQSAISERNEMAQKLAEREDQLVRLLQEDDYYYNAREAYERENSPELRAERAEQRIRDLQVSQQMQQINNEGNQFWESELEPAIGMLSDALPTVSSDELAERCVLGIQAYMELAPNGQPYIPSDRFDDVRKYVVEELAYWAKLKHEQRSDSSSTVEASTALEKLEKARVEAQKAKRLVGQKTKPVGRAGKASSPKKQRQAATLDDALDSALDSVLSQI